MQRNGVMVNTQDEALMAEAAESGGNAGSAGAGGASGEAEKAANLAANRARMQALAGKK
jgi:hypothetical protein